MPRRRPLVTFHMDRSVKLTFLAVAGLSASYFLWKWLGDAGQNPRSGALSKKRKRKVVPGLLNVGNSCFMNVILQSLASCPSFVAWLDDFVKLCKNDKKHVYMAEVLLKILKILTGETEHDLYYYDPSELLLDMSGRGWQISSDEQDAHEFFHAAITTLLEEYHHYSDKKSKPLEIFQVKELLEHPPNLPGIRKAGEVDDLPVQPPRATDPSFRGTLGCVLQCQTCGYKNPVRFDSFHSISLPLSPDLSWGMETSLSDCLMNYTSPEIVRDVECATCSTLCAGDAKGLYDSKSSLKDVPVKGERSSDKGEKCDSGPIPQKKITCDKNQPILSNNNTISNAVQEKKHTLAKYELMNNTVEIVKVLDNHPTCETQTDAASKATDKQCHKPSIIKLNLTSSRQSINTYRGGERSNAGYTPVRRSFVRRLCIGKLPDCLCVHLQRLVWTRGTPMKKMNFVKFPEILDLGPYTDMARITQKKFPFYSVKTDFSMLIKSLTPKEMKDALLEKRAKRDNTDDETSNQQMGESPTKPAVCLQGGSDKETTVTCKVKSSHKSLYRLMSVIVHIGDWSFSGHFLAYRRISEENAGGEPMNRWICASDSMVRRATVEEVFSCPAYMLFYERIKD